MTNTQVTSGQALRDKIESKRYEYFTFPVLEITVKYRKPDLLKLSFNNSLPAVLADAVIDAYKESVNGTDAAEYREKIKNKNLEADNDIVKDLRDKGYKLLEDLVTSHRILNVPESDLDNNIISWDDVPENDALAFVFHLMNKAQEVDTEGGTVSANDIETFPNRQRKSKRNLASASGEAVRSEAV